MSWTRFPRRADLENGVTFVHATSRLNIAPADLAAFVDPPDAAIAFGFRALTAGDPFEKSFPVWMATFRRRGPEDAVLETVQRVFPQLVDEDSLMQLFDDLSRRARELGYRRVVLTPTVLREPLFAPMLKRSGTVVKVQPTAGVAWIDL